MGFQAQKFGFMQGWAAQSATAMYSQPTGKLGGFFHDPKLYHELSKVGAAGDGRMNWECAKKLESLAVDPRFAMTRYFADPSLGELAPYVPIDGFVSGNPDAKVLANKFTSDQLEVPPMKLLASRTLSQRSEMRMGNIPLNPDPEDTADIKRVIGNALTEKAQYFLRGNPYSYEKLAETMWFSMLWYGFSKFSPERRADIKVVMENLEDELHTRLLGATQDLNVPSLDKKLIAAATIAVVHPEAFTVDKVLLHKAVIGLTTLTAHQNEDVSHNATHMLVRLVKIAGDAHPEVVSAALARMTSDTNMMVSSMAAEMLARVVESNGIGHYSIVSPAMHAMNGVMIRLNDGNPGDTIDATTKYFAERYLRIGVIYETSTALRTQLAMEKLARVNALVQERLLELSE